MGTLTAKSQRSRQESRTIVAIIAAIVLPCILMLLLVAADMRPDLSDLQPLSREADLIGWPQLDAALTQGRPVRLLGYMMDLENTPNDTPVQVFILMPEAGTMVHAAHRIPEEMIEVRLSKSVLFRYRSLVWVGGIIERSRVRSGARYLLEDASVRSAADSYISRWFR